MKRATLCAALLWACSAGSPAPKPSNAPSNPSVAAPTSSAPVAAPVDETATWWSARLAHAREAAAAAQGDDARIDALKQLAWARDPAGVKLAIAALGSPSAAVQKTAAMALAEYGSASGAAAKEPLLAALQRAAPEAKPALAWALVVLGEPRVLSSVLALQQAGQLEKAERLEGGSAFDARRVGELGPVEKFVALAGDANPQLRALAAAVLADRAQAKLSDVLVRLASDSDVRVARASVSGLAKLGDPGALAALTKTLRSADDKRQIELLRAIGEGAGTSGLVLALAAAPNDEKSGFWYRKRVFDLISSTVSPRTDDPSGSGALVRFIESKPHIYFQTRAALALAALGDLRAVPALARRLRLDPLALYSDKKDWELALKRDDTERVGAARMLADLAVLHPDAHATLEKEAADALIFWAHELPVPHANALRALAAMGSKKDLQALRDWASPKQPLPELDSQPPMPEEWVLSQVALRYLGKQRDEPSWPLFPKALVARPRDVDVTMEATMQGGIAILAMSLRALGVGAADGISEWGDHRGFLPLLDYVEDGKNNEQSRMSACAALGWVASDGDFAQLVDRVQRFPGSTDAHRFSRACFIETLLQRRIPGLTPRLLAVLAREADPETRHQLARAIAKSGIDDESRAKLVVLLGDNNVMTDAALALLLGGSPQAAAFAVARVAERQPAALEELKEIWYKSFGYWSNEDLDGSIFRYVDNAAAVAHVSAGGKYQDGFALLLGKQLDDLEYDNGPHSVTRVVLRCRLWQLAKGSKEPKRAQALRTLELMRERGVLFALSQDAGAGAGPAKDAHFRVLSPKLAPATGDAND